MPKKSTFTIESRKHLLLSYIYQLRVLSYNLILTYIFPDTNPSYCIRLLKMYTAEGYIEKTGTRYDNCYYYITRQGQEFLKNYGIIPIGGKTKEYPEKYLIPAHLKLNDMIVQHQLNLNEYVLRYVNTYQGELRYYDEKYVGAIFKHIRPDGVLYHDGIYYFLEMDMNTERKTRLRLKWDNYRQFLGSEEYAHIEAHVKVMFILGGEVCDTSVRKYNLKKYIDDNLYGYINDDFNLYIDTPDNLLNLTSKRKDVLSNVRNVLESTGFRMYKGTDTAIPKYTFDYRAAIMKDGKILSKNGIPYDFMVDIMTDENMYTYRKIAVYPEMNTEYKYVKGFNLNLLRVVKSEMEAYKVAKDTGVYSARVFYTTADRLRDYSFYSALFQVDKNGYLYHFSNNDLGTKEFERNILGIGT